jgi:hypothetical protein
MPPASRLLSAAALLQSLRCALSAPYSIDAFGAVAGEDTHAAALANGAALLSALRAANASADASSRAALVPAGKVYAYLPGAADTVGLVDVTLLLEGTLALFTDGFDSADPAKGFPGWPNPWPALSFSACSNLTVESATGGGLINGRGNNWWWYTIFLGDHRNNLLTMSSCAGATLRGFTMLNAPQYFIDLHDAFGATVDGLTIRVDVDDQLAVYRYVGGAAAGAPPADVLRAARRIGPASAAQAEGWAAQSAALAAAAPPARLAAARAAALPAALSAQAWFDERWRVTPPVPMVWALNTDGIDVSGVDITIRHCSVTNFDDSLCVKPLAAGESAFNSTCSSRIVIADSNVTWGVGASMGSVPPETGEPNCIDGVVVQRINFTYPLKGVYVKPNPAKGPGASARIANVVYENITMFQPVWWSIFVGTQQQEQPGTAGTGCSFLYPLPGTACPTDPQVTLANITLRNFVVTQSVLSPGIVIANASNPGTGFVFDNVVFDQPGAWPVNNSAGGAYLCANVHGVATGGTSPVPSCFGGA